MLLAGPAWQGCSKGAPKDERDQVAELYAEILIAESRYRNDSAQANRAVDSLLTDSRFESIQELRNWLEELTIETPEEVKELLDSTQRHLERARDGVSNTEPSTPTTTSDPPPNKQSDSVDTITSDSN